MFSLLRSFVGLLFFIAAAYFTFFVDLGDKPLSSHLRDVWESPVVQEKVGRIKDGVSDTIEERLTQAGEKVRKEATRDLLNPADDISDADRSALEALIEKAQKPPKVAAREEVSP